MLSYYSSLPITHTKLSSTFLHQSLCTTPFQAYTASLHQSYTTNQCWPQPFWTSLNLYFPMPTSVPLDFTLPSAFLHQSYPKSHTYSRARIYWWYLLLTSDFLLSLLKRLGWILTLSRPSTSLLAFPFHQFLPWYCTYSSILWWLNLIITLNTSNLEIHA